MIGGKWGRRREWKKKKGDYRWDENKKRKGKDRKYDSRNMRWSYELESGEIKNYNDKRDRREGEGGWELKNNERRNGRYESGSFKINGGGDERRWCSNDDENKERENGGLISELSEGIFKFIWNGKGKNKIRKKWWNCDE